MPYRIILSLLCGGSVFTLALLLYTAVTCRLARRKFQKLSRGLPMPDGIRTLGNGATLWSVRKNLNSYLWERSKEIEGKTFGSLYGTVPMVLTQDFDLIRRIRAAPDKHINRMSTLNLPVYEIERSLFLLKDDEWRRVRGSFAPAIKSSRFTKPNVVSEVDKSIEKLVGLIDSKLADESKLEADGGRRLELDDLMHRYTLDQFFACLYKQSEQINFDERPCRWVEMVEQGIRSFQNSLVIRACMIFPILVPLVEWLIWNFHPQGLWRRNIVDFITKQTRLALEARKQARELIAERHQFDPDNFTLKDGTHFRRNMLDNVVDHFLDGKLTKGQFFDTSFFLLTAADKTTCDCIVHTLYQIAVNPEIQERLRECIEKQGTESEYLGWVINESLRLMPPVSCGCARTLGEDMEIEDGRYLLPEGTFVVMPTYVIHRLPEYWGQDSEEFKPERWRDTSSHDACQYMPFGAGTRGCPGKDLALFVIRKLLVALLTRYKFQANTKEDLHLFDSPFFFVCLPNSPTFITIHKLRP